MNEPTRPLPDTPYYDWPHSPLLDDFDVEFAFGPGVARVKWVPVVRVVEESDG